MEPFGMSNMAFSNMVDDITSMVIVLVGVAGGVVLLSQVIKAKAGKKLAPAELAILEQITRVADRMDARLSAVERVLDSDSPAWRDPSNAPNDRRFG